MKHWLALIAVCIAAVPAFAQTDSDTNGTGISHGFAVSDGDTVRFGRQRVHGAECYPMAPLREPKSDDFSALAA
jgi:hypothetical protein